MTIATEEREIASQGAAQQTAEEAARYDNEHAESEDDEEVDDDEEEDEDDEDDDENDEEEEEEDEDEDEDEDEEEPKFKYQRLSSAVSDLLKSDTATALAVSEKFLVLGTRGGAIHVLDFSGLPIHTLPSHSGIVNDLCIDTSGDYVASASEDGRVLVNPIYSTGGGGSGGGIGAGAAMAGGTNSSDSIAYVYRRPIKSVALDPNYSRKSKIVASGGLAGQLTLNEKGWFSHKDNVIHAGEGPIYAVRWRATLIAWANDAGVKIYDTSSQQRITFIDRPKGSPRAELYRCSLCWKTDSVLLIAWADSVRVAVVRERSKQELAAGLPSRFVEIICDLQTEHIICGIAPFQEYLVLLASSKRGEASTKDKAPQRPEIRIVNFRNEEISSDALGLLGFETNQVNDYRLEYLASENLFYVVSPRDVVVARPRDVDDHVNWLVDHKRYIEALRVVESNKTSQNMFDIGQKYLNHLLQTGKYDEAAANCTRLLKNDARLWERWVFRFAEINQLRAITPFIPVQNPQLSNTVYEMALAYFLNSDHQTLLKTIRLWSPNLYSIQNVIVAVEDILERDETNTTLMDVAAELYTYDGQYERVLAYYLRLKRNAVFDLINKYNLFNSIRNRIRLLMEFDEGLPLSERANQPAVQLLVKNVDQLPVAEVVAQLERNKKLLHIYLHAIFVKNPQLSADFHQQQVELYAEYDYPKLMDFLKTGTNYSFEKALELCEQRELFPEIVYLLGRMGNKKRALMLIIEKLGDVTRAIDYAKEENEDELWDDLITYSIDKPKFITGLLENVGSHIDPIKIVNRIPKGLEIPHLKASIIKILQDYNLQMSLREGCEAILAADSVDLMERLHRLQRKGMRFNETVSCSICSRALSATGIGMDEIYVIFFCQHAYHSKCLQEKGTGDSSAARKKIAEDAETMSAKFCPMCTSDSRTAPGSKKGMPMMLRRFSRLSR